ncbi:MAG: hypothetical protein HQK72_11775 [Desulfamplus sp.]|nr:hypothetical protein [Desulfamplus sp.]
MQIDDVGQFIEISTKIGVDSYDFKISCFLVGVENSGELETLMKAIKAKTSIYADCLSEWRRCLEEHHEAIGVKNEILSDKEFDKFWVNNYIRFDTCSSKEKRQAFKKCSMVNFDYIIENKKDIFNFDHPLLNPFKDYLNSFNIADTHNISLKPTA